MDYYIIIIVKLTTNTWRQITTDGEAHQATQSSKIMTIRLQIWLSLQRHSGIAKLWDWLWRYFCLNKAEYFALIELQVFWLNILQASSESSTTLSLATMTQTPNIMQIANALHMRFRECTHGPQTSHYHTNPVKSVHCFMQVKMWKHCQNCKPTSWHWLNYRNLSIHNAD